MTHKYPRYKQTGLLAFILMLLLQTCIYYMPGEATVQASQEEAGSQIQGEEEPDSDLAWQEGDPRLVAGTLPLAEIAAALQLPLVGVSSHKAEALPTPYRHLPQVGSGPRVNYELLASLEADYYLTTGIFQAITQDKALAAGVEPLFYDIARYEDLFSAIDLIGQQFDREALAQALIQELKSQEALALEGSSPLEGARVFIFFGSAVGLYASSNDMYIGSLVEKLGMENIADAFIPEGSDYADFSTESVVALNPDYIIIYTMTNEFNLVDDSQDHSSQQALAAELDQAIWQETAAFQEGRVLSLTSDDIPIHAGLDTVAHLNSLKEALLEVGAGLGD